MRRRSSRSTTSIGTTTGRASTWTWCPGSRCSARSTSSSRAPDGRASPSRSRMRTSARRPIGRSSRRGPKSGRHTPIPIWGTCSTTARRRTGAPDANRDRKSTRLNSSHSQISYAVFCLKTELRQGGVDLSEDVDGLAIRVQRGDDKTFFIHGGRARDSDPWTDANGPRISDDRFPHRPPRNVPAFHTVLARRTIVGPAKNPRVNLATVRRPQKFREFVGGLVQEFRRRLPAREVPPVPFLEVADDPEEIRLQAVMGGPVVQGGPDDELAADRDDPELVVSHGRGRISARAPHARLDEIPDDGKQAFEGLRLDGQVATRRQGHEGFSRAVQQVHRDRAGGFQQASPGLHAILRGSESGSQKGSPAVGRNSRRRGRWGRASSLAAMAIGRASCRE